MTFTVLVVCSANVCRSPMAAAVLQRAFKNTQLSRVTDVSSCGVNARLELPMCDKITSGVLAPGAAVRVRENHRPSPLAAERLLGADLVLAADRSIRSAAVRMEPSVHERTFTLREAATLANFALSSASVPEQTNATRTLQWFVAEMNDTRGLAGLPKVVKYRLHSRPWRRVPVHAHDIPDEHRQDEVPRGIVQHLVVSATEDLAATLLKVTT